MARPRKRKDITFHCCVCGCPIVLSPNHEKAFEKYKLCEECENKFKNMSDDLEILPPNKYNRCIVCGKYMRKGDACKSCFNRLAKICAENEKKPEKYTKFVPHVIDKHNMIVKKKEVEQIRLVDIDVE